MYVEEKGSDDDFDDAKDDFDDAEDDDKKASRKGAVGRRWDTHHYLHNYYRSITPSHHHHHHHHQHLHKIHYHEDHIKYSQPN